MNMAQDSPLGLGTGSQLISHRLLPKLQALVTLTHGDMSFLASGSPCSDCPPDMTDPTLAHPYTNQLPSALLFTEPDEPLVVLSAY